MRVAEKDLKDHNFETDIIAKGFMTWRGLAPGKEPCFKEVPCGLAVYHFYDGLAKETVWVQMELLFQLAITLRGEPYPPGYERIFVFKETFGK
jgi:hypothetical protein